MAGIDDYLDGLKQRNMDAAASRAAVSIHDNPAQPDAVAGSLQTAQALGEAPGAVLANPEHYSDLLARKRAADVLRANPELSGWIEENPAVNGALAKDDLEGLGWFKRGLANFSLIGQDVTDGQVARGVKTGVTMGKQLATASLTAPLAGAHKTLVDRLDAFDRAKDMAQDLPRFDIAAQLGIDPESDLAALAADFVGADPETRKTYVDDAIQSVTGNRELMDSLTARVRAYSEQMKATQGRVPNFTDAKDLKDFADWAGFNIGQAAPMLLSTLAAGVVAGPVGAGAAGYAMGVGDIRAEQITAGQDPYDTTAAGAAALGAVPYAALEYLGPAARPFRGVSGDVLQQVAQGWAQRAGREVAESSVEEFINEAGQEIIKDYAIQMGGGPDVVLDDATLLKWFNSGMAGMVSGGGMAAAQSAYSSVQADTARAERAGQTSALLDQVARQAEASKLRQRAPERFRELLDRMLAESDTAAVYVPADGLREYFQARDLSLDAEIAAAWGLDLDEFELAEASGGKVALPLSNFAAHIAGTDAEGWVRQNATALPDEMSESEAQSFADRVPADLVDEYERELRQIREADARRTSDQATYDEFFSQLRGAGRTADVAEKEARILGAFFRSMADRTGDDSFDLARRFGLQIKGPDQADIPRRRGSLDILLNDLRSGRKEKTGRSLTQFVIDEGGVQDVGGDVAELEIKGLVAETAGEIRARRAQPVLYGLPVQGKGLSLDDLGRKAVEAGYFPELMGEVQGLNEGEAADLGAALLEALRDEASGNLRYAPGEGPDPARAALSDALQRRGIDPAAMTNDEIAAALESSAEGVEYGQSSYDKGGRAAPVSTNGDMVLHPVAIPEAARADNRQSALSRLADSKGEYQTASGEAVTISRAARKIFSGSFPDGRLRLAGAIPELLQSAVVYNADAAQRAYAVALADVDGQSVAVRMVLNNDGSGADKLYSLEGFEVAPIAWRNAEAEVSDQEQDGAGPAVGSAPVATVADLVAQINALPDGARPLYQDRDGKRGSIQFPAGGPDGAQTIINLFEGADLSTLIHESGHFFLEAFAALASDPDAPQALRDDMAAVRAYLGNEAGAAFSTDQHETFARSLEAYLMEGKAPSLELTDVFARAKAWLTRIYRSLAGLDVKLSPQIREVFDRMLATDAEIAAARADLAASPLFREKPSGMGDADWRAYQRLAQRSKDEADARLRERTLEAVRRKTERWWKDERAQVKAEVAARVNALPQYRLIEAMANGRVIGPDGEVSEAPDVRIDRKTLVDQFGAGVLAELTREKFGGKRAVYGDDGLPPDVAADMFGFAGAAEMIGILQNTGKRAARIEAETDATMQERYGDPLTDGSIEAEAMDAIHNRQQEQKNVAEARQIAASLGRDTRNMTGRVYRLRAARMLGRMNVREATASARFLAAERRAAREAERAFAKVVRGDSNALAAALQAKEQQILNAALYDLSREAEAAVGRAREKMQAYGKKSVREKLAGGYIEQIDDLLDRYDFRRRGPGQVAKAERLRDFIARMQAEGREAELAIDPRLEDEAQRKHYSRLSLDEFQGLVDTIANIDHMGRFKQRLITRKKQRELQDSADAVSQVIADNIGTGKIKKESRIRSALDLVLTADTVMIDMDGGDEFGTAYQELKEDIDAGQVLMDEMHRELSEKLTDLFGVYSKAEIRDMKRERHINGTRFVWSKWKAISVALNVGNGDNLARLLAEDAHPDQRMTATDLEAVLAALDKRDWDFVQSMWDQIDSYWDEIAAVTERRTGVRPGKVEAGPVVTPHGSYRGGYYPIKYDPGYGAAAAVDSRTEMDRFMSAGRFAKAQTKHGHTIERKKTGNGRTLLLDMDVAFAHMRDVTRDIALSEAVDNAYRILNHKQVAQAFMEAGRKADLDMLNLWLKDVAQGPIVHSDTLNAFARIVKNNFTLSRLALNLKTAVMQMTGAAQSAAVVGKRPMARAMMDYLKRPNEMATEVMRKSEFMRRRQTTFNKDIHDFANDVTIASPTRGRIADAADFSARWGFLPMTKVQFYAVDAPTWLAGYRNGLRKFEGDEARAIAFADRMVARSQDNAAMADRSAVSRGTLSETVRQAEWVKLFTTLQGYMIAKFNRGYVEVRRGAGNVRAAESSSERFAATADMAANLMLLCVAETVAMGLLYAALAAGDDDDDTKAEGVFMWGAGQVAGTVVGGLPLVRDGWAAFSDFGDGGGVYGSVMEVPSKVWKQAAQGENDKAFRRAMGDALGLAAGFPSVAFLRPIEEMAKGRDGSLIDAMIGRNPLQD